MEGITNFSRRLKLYALNLNFKASDWPDSHILRQIYAALPWSCSCSHTSNVQCDSFATINTPFIPLSQIILHISLDRTNLCIAAFGHFKSGQTRLADRFGFYAVYADKRTNEQTNEWTITDFQLAIHHSYIYSFT